jgi:hypothetical protein
MTLLCYILALVCFFIAVILPSSTPPPDARLRITALGLLFWLLPALLTAASIAHS